MPKTFPIRLEVEEIALGAVLRKLNDMPGIAKLDLDLGHGGDGTGRKQLEDRVAEKASDKGGRQAIVIKLLMTGEKHISEISRTLGGKATRAYGVMTALRKAGLAEPGEGPAMHRLTKKAMAQIEGGPRAALPAPKAAPAKVAKGAAGRAIPGAGNIVLRNVLNDGPLKPEEIRAKVAEHGMSPKSLSGILERAKQKGLIKKNGAGYELTAKGQKIETAPVVEASNG